MYTPFAIIGDAIYLLVGLYALCRGGSTERWGAALIIGPAALCIVIQGPFIEGPGKWIFLVDLLLVPLFCYFSLRTRAIWTIFLAAFQIDTVLTHLVAHRASVLNIATYTTAVGVFGGYGEIFALLAGVIATEVTRHRLSVRTG